MRKMGLLTALVLGGCAGVHPYGYSRTYEPLADEARYLQTARSLSYEEARRDLSGHGEFADQLLSFWGTVVEMEGTGPALVVRLDQRYHQERHQCSGPDSDSCRVTISQRVGGPLTVHLQVQGAHRVGRNRLSPGSLVRVYGRLVPGSGTRGGPVIDVDYYRHFPGGTYVMAGRTDRMRR